MTAMMALSGGDVISLSLPQFTSSNTSSVLLDLEGRSAGVFNASMAQWNETAQVLLLRVAGSAGHVRVGAEHSITIRVLGLSFRGDFASVAGQGITISTVAAAGNVLQTNVSRACRSQPLRTHLLPPLPSEYQTQSLFQILTGVGVPAGHGRYVSTNQHGAVRVGRHGASAAADAQHPDAFPREFFAST